MTFDLDIRHTDSTWY